MMERCDQCGGLVRGRYHGFEAVCRCFTGRRQKGLERLKIAAESKTIDPEVEKLTREMAGR
jgi:hypothetical protein